MGLMGQKACVFLCVCAGGGGMKVEGESERDGEVGGEELEGEVYRMKELIMARLRVEVVMEGGRQWRVVHAMGVTPT